MYDSQTYFRLPYPADLISPRNPDRSILRDAPDGISAEVRPFNVRILRWLVINIAISHKTSMVNGP